MALLGSVTLRQQMSQRHTPITEDDRPARRRAGLRAGGRRAAHDGDRRRPARRREPDDALPALPDLEARAGVADDARVRAPGGGRGGAAPEAPTTRERVVAMVVHGSARAGRGPAVRAAARRRPGAAAPLRHPAARRHAEDGRRGGRAARWPTPTARCARTRRPRSSSAARRADRARVRAGLARRARARPVGRAGPRRSTGTCGRERVAPCTRPPRRRPRAPRRWGGRRRRRRRRRDHGRRRSRSTPPAAGCRWRCSSAATSRTARSRWSSKLVHGGLRYLAAGRRRAGLGVGRRARDAAAHVAPHLVRPCRS